MLILVISSCSRQMMSPTKKANSSQAQTHAIIEHRQRHIVMNHGSLLKMFLRRSFNPFPIQSVRMDFNACDTKVFTVVASVENRLYESSS